MDTNLFMLWPKYGTASHLNVFIYNPVIMYVMVVKVTLLITWLGSPLGMKVVGGLNYFLRSKAIEHTH